MALDDKDIRQLFDMVDGKVVWRHIKTEGMTAILRKAVDRHNAKSGQVIKFWLGGKGVDMVTAVGVDVTRTRIEAVLGKMKQRPVPEARPSSAAEPRSVVKMMAWHDPEDPKPDGSDKNEMAAWELREHGRMTAHMRSKKGAKA